MDHTPHRTSDGTGPRVWLLVGDKLGDNAQARRVADALPWPHETRTLQFLAPYRHGKPRFTPSLDHVDRERSDALDGPWPDLLLTIGSRPAMVALWIRARSGGRTRVVLLGRPKRWLDRFALVVAPSHYRLPAQANVLRIRLPLMQIDERRLPEAGRTWEPRLRDMPRPLIAVLVGGRTSPFRFDADVARDLVRAADEIARREGGSVFFSTSRRTPRAVVEALEAARPAGSRLFAWSLEAAENPHLGLLALADGFVVTGDSVSMMVEVARLGKPLAIFELPAERGLGHLVRGRIVRVLHGEKAPLRPIGDLLYRLDLFGYSRDLTEIHRRLYECGAAAPIGQPLTRPVDPVEDELSAVVRRVRELWEGRDAAKHAAAEAGLEGSETRHLRCEG